MKRSPDWVRFALALPVKYDPVRTPRIAAPATISYSASLPLPGRANRSLA